MSILSKTYFHIEAEAFAYLESVVWPEGKPVCPHCGVINNAGKLKNVIPRRKVKDKEGNQKVDENGELMWKYSPERHGLYKCREKACRKQFTVRVGTVFESSHVPLTKWLQAAYLMMSSKKGISAKQLERTLEVTYKTAWFMAHRLREAMRTGDFNVYGQGGGSVEVDETFIGVDKNAKTDVKKKNWLQRNKVLSIVDRDSGQVKSVVIKDLKVSTIGPIVSQNVSKEARLLTDEAPRLKAVGYQYAAHGYTNHSAKQYVDYKDRTIHTNTVEGYFSIFKRGMKGVYQHCDQKHLHRYLAEFDFRYNNRERLGVNDMERTVSALQGIVGKRLTYRA